MKIFEYARQKILTVLDKIQKNRRKKYFKKTKDRLQNRDFSLVSNYCSGCVLLHELGMRFNSQFVNLAIHSEDYIEYLENFDKYNEMPLRFIEPDAKKGYPIGKLGDLTIYFVHYKTNEQAREKWEQRKQRINKDNLFIIYMCQDEDGCNEEIMERFDRLPFPNKVMFTNKEYPQFKSAFFCKEFVNEPGVPMFYDFKNHFTVKRKYDVFDFVSWFNGETDLKKLDLQK